MSVSGISSSSFMNQNIASIQNQQQQIQKEFQSLAQEFQSGNLSPAQTAALPQNALPTTGTLAAPGSSSTTQPDTLSAHARSHHHHMHMHAEADADADPDSTTTPSLGQLGQAIQSGNASTAQQAYGSVQQDLQQIALNSDLITAQTAALQASSGLSLTV